MKKLKLFSIFILILTVSACSVQEKMSPEIFINRLKNNYDQINSESVNNFISDNTYYCFLSNKNKTDFLIEMNVNDSEDLKKISLACTQSNNENEFIKFAEKIILTYSPYEPSEKIVKNLFKNGKVEKEILYYDTQWYSYSSTADESGLYFSISNKKLNPPQESNLSLKSNDRADY